MATIIGPLVVLAQPVPAAAPASGLLGTVGCPLFCTSSLARIDPSAGTETSVATLGGLGTVGLVADPTSQLVYASSAIGPSRGGGPGLGQIFTIDAQTGAVSASPPLALLLLSLAFDPATHTLFGLTVPSTEVVRVDPATGADAMVADLPEPTDGLVLDPAAHLLYTESEDFTTVRPTGRLFAVSTQTGSVSAATELNPAVRSLMYDTSAGALFGVTDTSPMRFVRIDPGTGTETSLGSFDFGPGFSTSATIDPATHTAFIIVNQFSVSGTVTQIGTVNDQTGAGVLGTQTPEQVTAVVFQPTPITPQSIQADVSQALARGDISKAGIANALLAELSEAESARSRGQCGAAGNIYRAFINDVTAQTDKAVASATARELITEAQFLIANCP